MWQINKTDSEKQGQSRQGVFLNDAVCGGSIVVSGDGAAAWESSFFHDSCAFARNDRGADRPGNFSPDGTSLAETEVSQFFHLRIVRGPVEKEGGIQ